MGASIESLTGKEFNNSPSFPHPQRKPRLACFLSLHLAYLVPLEEVGCELLEGMGRVLSILVDLAQVRCSICMCRMH